MAPFPAELKKIKARIARYERSLRQEYETYGTIDDGAGKRYLLGPLYLLAGDVAGAVKSYTWFDRTFPDDIGEPFFYLCWTLALYRAGDLAGAAQKLRQTMLANLYLIPHLLGQDEGPLGIWHGSNYETPEYLQAGPSELWALWDEPAIQWARETYESPEFQQVRARYIEIERQLKDEPSGPKRSQLVAEAFRLRE